MSALSKGGVTLICNNKNGCAPINPLVIAPGFTLTFTHGLGTKNGNGYAAFKVRVLDEFGADVSASTGGLVQVSQPAEPSGLIDSIAVTNNDKNPLVCVIEITWEVWSPQVQLVEGTYTAPGPILPSRYPDIIPTFN